MSELPLRFLRGETLLGTIVLDPARYNFPWFAGTFTSTDDFAAVHSLFERELQLLEGDRFDANPDLWDAAWEAVCQPGLHILSADGETFTADPLIHIEGTHAWWR